MDGEMNEMILLSRYIIRNLSPGYLKESTYAASRSTRFPTYLNLCERGINICFLEI